MVLSVMAKYSDKDKNIIAKHNPAITNSNIDIRLIKYSVSEQHLQW